MAAQQTTASSLPARPGTGLIWLQALGQAVRDQGRPALQREVAFAQVLEGVSRALWEGLAGRAADQETLRRWLQETAEVPTADLRREAESTAAAVAGDLPSISRTQLVVYLAQASASIRQCLRRHSDPIGQRVPRDLLLQGPDDLLPLLPPRPALYRPGDRPDGLEQWRLEELLALNEVSEVWRAKPARGEGAPVVLKFYPEKLTRNEHFYGDTTSLLDLLQDEPMPGIAALQEVYPDRDPVCLKYELVEGAGVVGLVQKWARSEPSGPQVEQSAQLMLGLAQVVAQAHARPEALVHGNLKLAHMLLYPVPNGPLVLRVVDYGLGRTAMLRERAAGATAPPGLNRLLSRRGARGTLTASPQVLRGAAPGPADDVWSVGAIACQMLRADPTLDCAAGADQLPKRKIPQPVLRLVQACLVEQPEGRITARALVEELTQVLSPKVLAIVHSDSVEISPADPQLERFRQARERIRRLHERARQLEQKYDYAAAADLLEAVPERMREVGLYEALCRKRDRVHQLDREITTSLRAGKHQGLRARVEELLQLKPMRTELRELLNELAAD